MVHESIEFKQQLFATGSVGTSFQPCDHHSDGLLPPQRCVKNSSCSASLLSIQTCSKIQLAGRLARAVNCVNHHIYPGALINLNWEPVNISLRQSFCDVLRQLEGSFSSVVLCHWESAQSSDRGQHRAEQPLQSSWEAGLGVGGMALERHSSACMEISFFPLFCQ